MAINTNHGGANEQFLFHGHRFRVKLNDDL